VTLETAFFVAQFFSVFFETDFFFVQKNFMAGKENNFDLKFRMDENREPVVLSLKTSENHRITTLPTSVYPKTLPLN
jgi:hypothetical protein